MSWLQVATLVEACRMTRELEGVYQEVASTSRLEEGMHR